jgi:hypothetical protein
LAALAFICTVLQGPALLHLSLLLVAGVDSVVLAFDIIPGGRTAAREGYFSWYHVHVAPFERHASNFPGRRRDAECKNKTRVTLAGFAWWHARASIFCHALRFTTLIGKCLQYIRNPLQLQHYQAA